MPNEPSARLGLRLNRWSRSTLRQRTAVQPSKEKVGPTIDIYVYGTGFSAVVFNGLFCFEFSLSQDVMRDIT